MFLPGGCWWKPMLGPQVIWESRQLAGAMEKCIICWAAAPWAVRGLGAGCRRGGQHQGMWPRHTLWWGWWLKNSSTVAFPGAKSVVSFHRQLSIRHLTMTWLFSFYPLPCIYWAFSFVWSACSPPPSLCQPAPTFFFFFVGWDLILLP
jgi:hypothetical protein